MPLEQNNTIQTAAQDRVYFNEPRLLMTLAGRIFVRIVSYVLYVVFLVGGFALAFSDILQLRALGIFIILFFADIAIHLNQGDKPFSEMKEGGRVNLAEYFSPAAYSTLEKSFDRSLISKN